eukprot:3754035-Amphidinium_carterae.1
MHKQQPQAAAPAPKSQPRQTRLPRAPGRKHWAKCRVKSRGRLHRRREMPRRSRLLLQQSAWRS